MIDTSTGLRRVRAGLPQDWQAGDKTGTSLWPGMKSLYVDIGFVEPLGFDTCSLRYKADALDGIAAVGGESRFFLIQNNADIA